MITFDNTNNGILTLKSPVSGSTSVTFPPSLGSSGQALITDGSGNLSWSNILTVPIISSLNDSIVGTTSKLVGSLILPAATYLEVIASFGSLLGTDSSTIDLKVDNTTIKTLTKTGLVGISTLTGFTLSTESIVDIYITAGTSTATTIITGITIK